MENGQLTLSFETENVEIKVEREIDIIRDRDCTINTPVNHGNKPLPIYGNRISIIPTLPGRTDTPHMRKHYLEKTDPLETYDLFFVLFSGGKDSVAAALNLLELGVPPKKIILLHHDIDGNSKRKMDWPVTKNYCRAFAEAFGLEIRFSFREGGFWGEVYRYGSKQPVQFQDADGSMRRIEPSAWTRSLELKRLMDQAEAEDNLELYKLYEEELRSYGYRFKFPAKGANLQTRYCSGILKIEVGCVAITHQVDTKRDCKIMVVSGERRGESTNRSKYNMMELHRTHAPIRNKRVVHHFRSIIDFSEKDVWEVLRRNRVVPHPCYTVGWGRASCACCIFSSPSHFAGIKDILPDYYQNLRLAEQELQFTLDNNKSIDEFVGDAESCVVHSEKKAIHQLLTGEIKAQDIILPLDAEWNYPAGAFRHGIGGPC
ncbi:MULTISPECIES: phosphoadenosine phosphosulfate reductase family protein [unclassified Paenibacillus]|uniref:Phosphoadenosine phosphosulfate reductase family protein n=1 Tax=Paenibacillus provencensis TaxID=441151 RepID=A0ABW3Q9K4_9BACL|nr:MULTISPECIES: phosphoadenosine phosphosulfate reductase family protein [unclassified Paenibacillus]MCM3130180.1 phosphoadenosine phosphosulfate reductase family protein [Paenibacillus sp. MER 78]SDX71187.1 Phosphoadenosine phosphosulfate reductase family protein [Paenibacillus sp. PDC88]SFS88550.1 Phosphoadenosine phosphosulfate reductase family protein [Paenibacillus sp. 453mf]